MGPLHPRALSRALLASLAIVALLGRSQIVPAAPDAGASRLLSACEDGADFAPALSPDDPAFGFEAWEAAPFAGARVEGESLRWHVRPSGGQTSARLALTRQVEGPLGAIGIWVKNPNAHDLDLRLEAIDADGARYLSEPVDLSEQAGWREIQFGLGEMTGPDADPVPG